ncbi:nitroreductase family protein [Actinacidiphila glaucinigra]|uniref:nitroreductase family protein n=1 Tax=Actinacidiphila glaucinigra TaxID=235986 RepID=UPI0036E65B3C
MPLESRCRILDAAIRAPNGGNAQRWHFLAVDDPGLKARLAVLYESCRQQEHADIAAAGSARHRTRTQRSERSPWRASRSPGTASPSTSPRSPYWSSCSRSTTTAARTSARPSGAHCWPRPPRASGAC